MLKIIPAIDLIGGQNVRLSQGDYQTKRLMDRTPVEAIDFYQSCDRVARIHIVDLIGAKAKEAREMDLIASLAKRSPLPLEIGGGIRDQATLDAYDRQGLAYFILGTAAIKDVAWLAQMTESYPGRIFVGLDAREDRIFINGWTEDSGLTLGDYLPQVEDLDLAGLIYTDIDRDGMKKGPNLKRTASLRQATRHKVVASGGVRNLADLIDLENLGIEEAVVGKACNTDEFWRELGCK